MKIALTNLGKYNEGELVYTWLELPFTEEELEEAKSKIGINERYEEYFISDTEVEEDDYPCKVREYCDISDLNEKVKKYEEYDEYDKKIIRVIYNNVTSDIDEAMNIVDKGNYSYVSTDDYGNFLSDNEKAGYAFVEQVCGNVSELSKETIENYFDYEAFGRDLLLDGGISDEDIVLFIN